MHPNDGRVVSNFIVQALLNRDIAIDGDGLQSRAFCYVDDMVDGLMRPMAAAEEVTGPINLGNPTEISIIDLTRMTIDLTGSRSSIVHRPARTDDPRQRQPNIARARKVLDWAPQTALKDGLSRTVSYFERLLTEIDIRRLVEHRVM